MERRLAAILAADMVGFSRLMEADEVGTLTRQKLHRAELIDPRIEAHGGKIIKLTGDGMIAEFPSVVEAVQCAVTIQREMDAREADEPEDRRIRYRIAVNLGDVIFDEGDVYGDGVNIAARLEALADPGGVLVSGSAYDQLKANIDVGYEDLGEKQVKNIETPVRVYRVVPGGTGTVARKQPGRGRLPILAAAACIVLLIAGGVWWWLQRPEFTPADPSKMEYALDKPSIAVLAFDNLTGNPEQERVSDGISEDIISTLARLPGVVVIARNSSFSYKGKPVDIRKIAEEMSVRYVLEGSVQSFGENIRITAQLIDAVSGHHVWSQKFDRPRADFFKIRDEITFRIVQQLNIELVDGDAFWHTGSFKTLEGWLLARKAVEHYRRYTKADNQIALELMFQILAVEPDSLWANSAVAWRNAHSVRFGWADDPEASLRTAIEYAEKTIALNEDPPHGFIVLAYIRYVQGRLDEAVTLGEKALELAPGDPGALGLQGLYNLSAMRPNRAIDLYARAIRVNRRASPWMWRGYGEAFVMVGRHEEAIPALLSALKSGAQGVSARDTHLGLAVAYDAVGDAEKSEIQVRKAREVAPQLTISMLRKTNYYADEDYNDHWLATLKRLGVPEE